jgi:hypothetical protein
MAYLNALSIDDKCSNYFMQSVAVLQAIHLSGKGDFTKCRRFA